MRVFGKADGWNVSDGEIKEPWETGICGEECKKKREEHPFE